MPQNAIANTVTSLSWQRLKLCSVPALLLAVLLLIGFYPHSAGASGLEDAVRTRGREAIAQHDYSSALKCFDALVAKNAKGVDVANRGYCYMQISQYPLAISDFSKAIAS